MRIDKYLQLSRIIKRRVIAKKTCNSGKVFINRVKAEPSSCVNINDVIKVSFVSECIVASALSNEVVVNNRNNATKICKIIDETNDIVTK